MDSYSSSVNVPNRPEFNLEIECGYEKIPGQLFSVTFVRKTAQGGQSDIKLTPGDIRTTLNDAGITSGGKNKKIRGRFSRRKQHEDYVSPVVNSFSFLLEVITAFLF